MRLQMFCVVAASEKVRDAIAQQIEKTGVQTVVITAQSSHTDKRGVVYLSTMHRAKGLEFDHVAILNGGWDRPSRGEDADAPRRLFYVAMTRARSTLTVLTDGAFLIIGLVIVALLVGLAEALPQVIADAAALGVAAAPLGLPPAQVIALYLHAFASNLTSAAVRFVPLGQNAGQQALSALHPLIEALAAECATATTDDITSAALAADLAAMRHETMDVRIFKT